MLKVNVLSPFAKTGSLFYENAFSLRSSAQLGLLYTGFTYKKATARGFALTPEYRYYMQRRKQSPFGFYAGAYIRLQSLTFTRDWTYGYNDPANGFIEVTEEGKATLETAGGGLLVGHQSFFKNRYSVDLFAGPGYNYGKLKTKNGPSNLFDTSLWEGFTLRFGATLGIVIK